MSRYLNRIAHATVAVLALAACDGGPAPLTDGGDDTVPVLVSTSPVNGALLVATDAPFEARFSEAMLPDAGTLSASSDSGPIALELDWNADGDELVARPSAGWPAGEAVTVTVESDFTDLSGNPLEETTTVSFTVIDLERPTIVSTTPVEGSTVSPDLAAVSFELSEDVRTDGALLRIEGPGAPTLGEPTWSGRTVTASVAGLEHDGDYRVFLEGVRDASGNALDPSSLGAEGALDFRLGADDVAPVVVDSDPAEGQLDVVNTLVTRVAILFSEPMDPAMGTATLVAGGASETLTPSWEAGNRRLVLGVRDRLLTAAAHRVELAGFADVAGNALDGATYLGDGALDFTTGDDLYEPHVAYAEPADGATDVAAGFADLVIVFSEAMDTSTDRVTVVGDGGSVELTGTWSMSGSTLLVPVGDRLQSGRSYSVDLTGFRDRTGTPLDATHPYLGDGVLAWTYAAPTGEGCGDALTETEATTLTGGTLEWTIAASAVTRYDGSIGCYPSTASTPGPDALIRYRKTSADTAGGGAMLHIRAEGRTPTTGRVGFEVYAASCSPTAAGADAARQFCHFDARPVTDAWLDVGPGDYFIWVAGASTFAQSTIRVDEVALPPEGESCANPLSTSSSAAVYTPPASEGGAHVWTLGAGSITGLDRTSSPTTGPDYTCEPGAILGYDAVVEYTKTSATSLVTVDVRPMAAAGATHILAETSRGCDVSDSTRSVLACERRIDTNRPTTVTVDGAVGPLTTWLSVPAQNAGSLPGRDAITAFPPTVVEVREFEPGVGDTCANAIPVTVGSPVSITPTRANRAYAPSCLDDGGITWYRFTATSNFTLIRTDVDTPSAVIDATSGAELRCGDPLQRGAAAFVAPGTSVCLAVASNPSVTTLTIEPLTFDGVRGVATDLGVTRPLGADSVGLTVPRWIVPTATSVMVGAGTNIVTAPRAGGDFAFTPVTPQVGFGGLATADGSVLSLFAYSGATESRLYRVASGSTLLPTPIALDTAPSGPGYPTRAMGSLVLDGTNVFMAQDGGFGDATTELFEVPVAGGAATRIGSNEFLDDVSGIAATATDLYIAGRNGTLATGTKGIWRLPRAELGNPAAIPTLLLAVNIDASASPLFYDEANDALYFRTFQPAEVWMILEPGAAGGPRWAGPLWRPTGERAINDSGLGFDPTGPSLYFIDHTGGDAAFYRLD